MRIHVPSGRSLVLLAAAMLSLSGCLGDDCRPGRGWEGGRHRGGDHHCDRRRGRRSIIAPAIAPMAAMLPVAAAGPIAAAMVDIADVQRSGRDPDDAVAIGPAMAVGAAVEAGTAALSGIGGGGRDEGRAGGEGECEQAFHVILP